MARSTSSQVFPDPNRNEMGRLTHPTRSSIRCAFVTFATRPGRSDGAMMAWVFGGGDKFKLVLVARSLVIPDGARSAEIGDLVPQRTWNEVPGLASLARDDEICPSSSNARSA